MLASPAAAVAQGAGQGGGTSGGGNSGGGNSGGGNSASVQACALTHGQWGGPCAGRSPGCFRDAWFDTAFPQGLFLRTVEPQYIFYSAANVEAWLPNQLEAETPLMRNLASHLAALALNIAFSEVGAWDRPSAFAQATVNAGPYAGWTAQGLFDYASDLPANEVTGDLVGAIASVNGGHRGCKPTFPEDEGDDDDDHASSNGGSRALRAIRSAPEFALEPEDNDVNGNAAHGRANTRSRKQRAAVGEDLDGDDADDVVDSFMQADEEAQSNVSPSSPAAVVPTSPAKRRERRTFGRGADGRGAHDDGEEDSVGRVGASQRRRRPGGLGAGGSAAEDAGEDREELQPSARRRHGRGAPVRLAAETEDDVSEGAGSHSNVGPGGRARRSRRQQRSNDAGSDDVAAAEPRPVMAAANDSDEDSSVDAGGAEEEAEVSTPNRTRRSRLQRRVTGPSAPAPKHHAPTDHVVESAGRVGRVKRDRRKKPPPPPGRGEAGARDAHEEVVGGVRFGGRRRGGADSAPSTGRAARGRRNRRSKVIEEEI